MRLSYSIAIAALALHEAEAFAIPPQHMWLVSFPSSKQFNTALTDKNSLTARAYRVNPVRRELFEYQRRDAQRQQQQEQQQQEQQQQRQRGGGLTIGGLTLGGPGGGITGGGLQLGGNRQNGNQQQQEQKQEQQQQQQQEQQQQQQQEATEPGKKGQKLPEGSPAGNSTEVNAGPGTENQPGRAEGEAARLEAQQEAKGAKEGKTNGVKATEESEKFSNESGITLDQSGNAQNLGGDLGITRGSDGSTSVGGANGIQVAAGGRTRVAGNE